MFPTLVELGPITIHSYGFMIAVGFLIALWGMRRGAAEIGINPDIVADAAFWTLLVGLVGTRVLHIIMFPEFYSWTDPIGWVAIWRGGLVFQGAILPIYIFLLLYLRWRGVSFCRTVDMAVPWMALCHAMGRFGCFLNGCCYGVRTDAPWGVSFPRIPWETAQPVSENARVYAEHCRLHGLDASSAHWSYPVHPTQLYASLGLLALFFVLRWIWRNANLFPGFTICCYLALYSVMRFVVEFFRGDHNPSHLGLISDQQIFAVITALCAAGAMVALRVYWKGRDCPAALDERAKLKQ